MPHSEFSSARVPCPSSGIADANANAARPRPAAILRLRPAALLNHRSVRAAALLLAFAPAACAQPISVTFRGIVNLPTSTTDQSGTAFTIQGLSGITFRGDPTATASSGEFLAVMDNSNKLVRLSVTFNPDASLALASVISGVSLNITHDFEGIAWLDAAAGTALLSEEGTPALHEVRVSDGVSLRAIPAPDVFAQRRPNFGLESLAARPPQPDIPRDIWTANEEALTPDGPLSTQTQGTVVRLLRYAQAPDGTMTPEAQHAYVTEPIHGLPITNSRSGLVELVELPDGRLLALERSLALGSVLYQSRLYEVSFGGADDVSDLPALAGATYTPVSKRLLWSGSVNNMEGLALGPRLPSGRYALLGIVDRDAFSSNAVVAFELDAPPTAGTLVRPARRR